MFNMKRSSSKLVSTRRSTLMSLSHQLGFLARYNISLSLSIDIYKKYRLLKFCYVPATSACLNR